MSRAERMRRLGLHPTEIREILVREESIEASRRGDGGFLEGEKSQLPLGFDKEEE